jgi:NitT/TauT family transport system permease protein
MPKKTSENGFHAFMPYIIPVLIFVAWFTASETGMIPRYMLPHPVDVGRSGYEYIFGDAGQSQFSGRFLSDLVASLARVLLGFILAIGIGIPLGVLSGRLTHVNRMVSTTINAMRAVPGISWLPLAMVWFGIGIRTTVFLVALAAFFPIYLNAVTGARQVDPMLYRAGAMMGVTRLRAIFSILLPSAVPYIITGLRLGLGISWAYLVLGELTGVPNGLGAAIMDARMIGRTDIIVVGIILIAVAGRSCDCLLNQMMKLCFKSVRRL